MKRTFYYFYKYCLLRPYSFVAGIALLVFASLSWNAINFFISGIVDRIENSDIEGARDFVIITTLTFIAARLIDVIGRLATDRYIINASRELKLDVMNKLHALDFIYHTNKNSGALISAFKRGDSALFSLASIINERLVILTADFIIIVVAFGLIDLTLAVIVISVSILSLITTIFLVRLNLSTRREFNEQEDRLTGVIVDNMSSFETVKYFTNESFEIKRLKDIFVKWSRAIWNYSYSFRAIEIVAGGLSILGIALSLGYSITKVDDGSFTIAQFVLVATFVTSFFPKFIDLIFNLREIVKKLTDMEKYVAILDQEERVKEREGAKDLDSSSVSIDFKNIIFAYPDRDSVINGVSLHIDSGQTVAFVGESGAGKTTMTKLLMRFYDLDSGSITINNQDISKITKSSLRSAIGMVPQDPIMFNNTIEFNIRYGRLDASDEEVRHAAKIARLDEFIQTLPEKYDTMVGERGIKLSGGQRQRLAIARVFLENPPIIIFDEATSQLDSESEVLIQEAFWEIAKNRTVIIIAHRLSTVLKADNIVVFDRGRITEQGTHNELLKQNGTYANLWNIQKGAVLNE